MANQLPSTNINDLVARATKATSNIDAHRQAMRTVAEQAKSATKAATTREVNKQ